MASAAKHKSFSSVVILKHVENIFKLGEKNHIVELGKKYRSAFCISLEVYFLPINLTVHLKTSEQLAAFILFYCLKIQGSVKLISKGNTFLFNQ